MGHLEIKDDIKGSREMRVDEELMGMNMIKVHEILRINNNTFNLK